MNFKTIFSIFLTGTALYIQTVHGADNKDGFAIKGAGIASCKHFTDTIDKKDKSYLVYGGWIEGYLTATNQQLPNTYDLAPWQSTQMLLVTTESVCRKNPNSQFYQVVLTIANDLNKQRITEGKQFIQVGTYIYQEEVIKRMKNSLKSRGLYSGNVGDAQYDEKLKAAVKQFQKGIKQPETGLPDQGTLYELFRPQK